MTDQNNEGREPKPYPGYPCETCGGGGAVYLTRTVWEVSVTGRGSIPREEVVQTRRCPECQP